jgi:hypothetical protein
LAGFAAVAEEITISYVEKDFPTGSQFLQFYYEEEMSYPALSPEEFLDQAAIVGGFENTNKVFREQQPGIKKIPVGEEYADQPGVYTVTLMVTPDATTQVLPVLSDASTPAVEPAVETAPTEPVEEEEVEAASEATAIVVAASLSPQPEQEMWPTHLELALPNYDKLHSEVVVTHTRTHILTLTDMMNKPATNSRENIDEFESLRQQEVDSLTAALSVSQTEIERQADINEDLVGRLKTAETKLASTEIPAPIVVEDQSSALSGSSWPRLAALSATALMALLAIAVSVYLYRDRKRGRKKINELEERNALLAQGLEQSKRRTGEWKGRVALLEEDIAKHRHHFHLSGMKPEILRLPIKKIGEDGTVWVKLPEYKELVPTAMIEGALRHLNPKILQDLGITLPLATLGLPAHQKLVLDFLKDPTKERAPTAV